MKKGFTLIKLLIVLSIVCIIGVSAGYFFSEKDYLSAVTEYEKIKSVK
jgi:prepilin-type N-terminal cleavage/methylation domain-containing protein